MGKVTKPGQRSQPGGKEELGWAIAAGMIVVVVLGVLGVWVAAHLGGVGHDNPVGWVSAVVDHATRDEDLGSAAPVWSGTATVWMCLFLALGLGVFVAAGALWWRWSKGREWTDPMARKMSDRRDTRPLEKAATTQVADRLGTSEAGIGLFVGKAVNPPQPRIWSNVESTQAWFMGPRSGKTSGLVARHLMENRFAAVMTTNKPDGVHETRGIRSEMGKVLAYDPQGIIAEPPEWYYPPQLFILAGEHKVKRAEELAGILQAAGTPGDAKLDAYFGPGGETLLSDLLLANALSGEPFGRVYDWVTYPDPAAAPPDLSDPVEVLREHGFDRSATSLDGYRSLNPKQRDGLYGGAQQLLKFLREPAYEPWYSQTGPQDNRPVFDPARFVTSSDTLYVLSKEGKGSARALTAALVNAVIDAALTQAQMDGGRLRQPVMFELDEAANICRLPDLPSWFSWFGSQGLLLAVYLQSREQGVTGWGESGIRQMLSGASLLGIGRGIRDDQHLEGLVKLIGEYDEIQRSRSRGREHRTHSEQIGRRQIFTVNDLAAFPPKRVIVFPAGARPVLVKNEGWYELPDWKDKGNESLNYYKQLTADRVRAMKAGAA